MDDEAYCSPRLCDRAYWKGWPWLVMFMCDLNQTWPHPEHLLVNLARSSTGLNLHMTTRWRASLAGNQKRPEHSSLWTSPRHGNGS